MFGLFKKDIKKELEKEYQKLLERAMEAQRNGNIELYSHLTSEAEEVAKKLDSLPN